MRADRLRMFYNHVAVSSNFFKSDNVPLEIAIDQFFQFKKKNIGADSANCNDGASTTGTNSGTSGS